MTRRRKYVEDSRWPSTDALNPRAKELSSAGYSTSAWGLPGGGYALGKWKKRK